jgi:hypothetical protein
MSEKWGLIGNRGPEGREELKEKVIGSDYNQKIYIHI